MKRSHITHLSFSTALLLALLLPAAAPAQNEFRLQRTKKESIPINVSPVSYTHLTLPTIYSV
jgi:hypothetical protein